MNKEIIIEELRKSYNSLEKKFTAMRQENERLHEMLKKSKWMGDEDETKRPAKSVQDTNLKPRNVCKSTVCE
ncbi:MAG: hypothetical protein J5I50_05190 [Chitinophagaceae bacterium]|nr:hypothetical protein [Chitinophagaceae bacterium]